MCFRPLPLGVSTNHPYFRVQCSRADAPRPELSGRAESVVRVVKNADISADFGTWSENLHPSFRTQTHPRNKTGSFDENDPVEGKTGKL